MEVVIIGAGGHGKVVLDILRAQNKYKPVGFIDADPALTSTKVGNLPVFGQVNHLPKLIQQKVRHAIVAVGDNRARHGYVASLMNHGFTLINAIHPSAVVSPTATLASNIVIAPGAVVSTEVNLGDSVIVNTNAVIEHESVIAPAVHVAPGALIAGRCRIGFGTFIGMGAKIIQCLTIGQHCVIGAGSVVIRDIPDDCTVVGVPARMLKQPAGPKMA